eukprot:TRINITY_DN4695_c0_g1_i1.p1 TRINITY_DN4695_c0_g1~~TRINITY_DN4695_c0_g1_i1.p1  ORF type:complete len:335 (-),score=18.36 TRINITY_DN4695_c0_g1_i1:51-1055(-)
MDPTLYLVGLLIGVVLLWLVLREKSVPNRKTQKLNRYKHAHLGYRPDLTPPDVHFDEMGTLATTDGTSLRTYKSSPKGKAKGLIFIFPGLNECVERNAIVAHSYAKAGFAVHAIDYPTYGRSDGLPRGYLPSYEGLAQELLRFTDSVRKEYSKDTKVFLCGQSLGGATSLRLALTRLDEWDGMILIAPAIASDVHQFVQKISGVLGMLIPMMPVVALSDSDFGCRNLKIAEELDASDVTVKGGIRARTGAELIRNLRFVTSNMSKLRTPFVVFHGEKDLLCLPRGTHQLMAEANSVRGDDKTAVWFPDAWHDLVHEPEHGDLCEQIVQWTLDRV